MTTRRRYIDIATVRLVREPGPMIEREPVNSPSDTARLARHYYQDMPCEVFAMFILNSNNVPTRFSVVSVGILNSSLVHPREVFQRAILANGRGVILLHNHPSGSLEPSGEDLRVTRQLADAGKVMGIPVLDHVILAGDAHTSFAERGLI